jgi:hypothetical protein
MGAYWKSGQIFGPAIVWAVLFAWPWTASGQASGDQPPPEQRSTPTAMTTPVMTGPLAANPTPTSVDAGFLGSVFVTGALSGLGLWQNNKFPDQQHTQASLSNGHLFLQTTEGLLQYFLDIGAYTIPTVGAPYFSTATTTGDFYGPVPMAWAKIAPTDNFYIEGGKLSTLIGAENAFTFQNMNIQRGLLDAQGPTISRGAQLGYTQGPLALALSWNDGFYSNRYTWLSGSATYTFNPANTVVLAAGGNFAHTAKATTTTPFFQTTAVPLFQNNESIFTLSYTHNSAPWTITPHFQFTHVPAASSIDAFSSASTIGGAILANYSFENDSPLPGVSLPIRFEYIGSTGSAAVGAPNLLYGPGSNAWSITLSPTYQYKIFFARAEVSHVGTRSTISGLVFGPNGTNTTQTRGVIEVGILF